MKYPNLMKLLAAERREYVRNALDFILIGWDNDLDRGIRHYSTDLRWQQYLEQQIDGVGNAAVEEAILAIARHVTNEPVYLHTAHA